MFIMCLRETKYHLLEKTNPEGQHMIFSEISDLKKGGYAPGAGNRIDDDRVCFVCMSLSLPRIIFTFLSLTYSLIHTRALEHHLTHISKGRIDRILIYMCT